MNYKWCDTNPKVEQRVMDLKKTVTAQGCKSNWIKCTRISRTMTDRADGIEYLGFFPKRCSA
jgi:hypothetical protein